MGSSGAKSPSALTPFAYDWIGGDIHGLSAYSGTLYGGVFDGIGDSAVKTGQDFATIGKSIWHGISSIF